MNRQPSTDLAVVIAAFNAEGTIHRSIASVRNTFDCPIYVVDDGSTDRTADVACAAGAVVLSQSNMGATAARQTGIRASDSELVILLDSDDELLPGMLAAIELLRADPTIAVAGGRIELASSRGAIGRFGPLPLRSYTTRDLLSFPVSPFPPSASVWRRDAILASYDLPIPVERTKYAEDYEMLIRASLVGSVHAVAASTCLYAAFGGKSSRAALEAITCAENIRIAYARALNIHVKPLNSGNLIGLAAWRTFRSQQAEYGLKSALCRAAKDPAACLRLAKAASSKVIKRLMRRVSGMRPNVGIKVSQ